MKKLLSLLAATGLVATSGSVAVACNKKAVDTASTASTDLSTIKGADLTVKPSDNTEAAAKTAVLAQIKTKLKLTIDVKESTDVVFSAFSAATSAKTGSIVATAADASKVLTPKKTATFALTYVAPAGKKDLSTITTKELGEFSGVGDKPTVGEVVKQVNAKNEGLNLSVDDVDMTKPSDKELTASATLTAKSNSTKFEKAVTVTYTYTKSAGETTKPVISVKNGSVAVSGAVDVIVGTPVTLTIEVANKSGQTLPTVTVPEANSAALEASAVTEQGDNFQVTLTAKGKVDVSGIKVAVAYEGAESVEVTVNVKKQATQGATPEISLSKNSVDIKLVSGSSQTATNVAITITNPAGSTKPTAALVTGGDSENLTLGQITGDNSPYTLPLTPVKAKDGVQVKISYAGAQDVTLTVNVKSADQ
ncbi:hypothetical protein SHELI_v1c10060 [Spiroplasma helicoides]|uniref:Spiralin n=1 Tax=Spiroplasma helicoides TaxID=216938 RepID=A0A1B3SM06_9MOLU|nr:lipoprotein [Spiroplasma helicoides]AOG60953.1 hypothetical protein SHELI_v1c10060 [Spiroplasma helicoides]